MFKNADLSFACSSPSSPFLRNPRRSFVMEHNPCMLSKSVCVLNEEPPSTSSPSNHFGLNPAETSKSRREREGPHSSGPLCSWGAPAGGLVSGVAVCQFAQHSTEGLNTQQTPCLSHKHTQSRAADTILLSETWRRLCFLQLKCVEEERFSSAYPFFFPSFSFITLSQHKAEHISNNSHGCKTCCGIS